MQMSVRAATVHLRDIMEKVLATNCTEWSIVPIVTALARESNWPPGL
jgi:hypothetical protein